MATDGQWSSSVGGENLPVHHTSAPAFAFQQLDHAWFYDNLLKPCVCLGNASFLSSSYRSIELIDATHNKWGSSHGHPRPGHRGMMPMACPCPCPRFEGPPHLKVLNPTHYLSEDSNDNLQSLHKLPKISSVPPAASIVRHFTSYRHPSPNPLLDTKFHSPAKMQSWSMKCFHGVKESQASRISQESKLASIVSAKQLTVSLVDGPLPRQAVRVFGTRKTQKDSSKSMTALEFDELRGSMDLGFQLSQDDLTPQVATMFPALKRKLGEGGELDKSTRAIYSMPKQSLLDAWFVRETSASMHHWRISATNEDIKEHLKFWARAVASTARQKC